MLRDNTVKFKIRGRDMKINDIKRHPSNDFTIRYTQYSLTLRSRLKVDYKVD